MSHQRTFRNLGFRNLHLVALPLLVSAAGLASACSSSDDPNSTTAASSATGSGGSTSATSSSDATGTGGTGGSVQNPDPCDPINNNCVEAEASKCTMTLDSDKYATATCEAPLGDQQVGEDCVRPDEVSGHDTCAPGLFCTNWQMPAGDPTDRECLALCDEATACTAAEQACVPISTNPYGVCLDLCKPFEGTCGSDPTQTCLIWSTVGGGAVFACGHSGAKATGEACQFNNDCPADNICNGGICRPLCDNAHLCAGASDLCFMLSDSPEVADFGTCQKADDSCLSSIVVDPPMNATEPFGIQVFDVVQGTALAGATVKACAANDTTCAAPLDQATSDATGAVTLTVPTVGPGFDGYFETTLSGFMPGLTYVNVPVNKATSGTFAYLITKADLDSSFVGSVTSDPSRGAVLALAFDCAYYPQGGAVFSVDTADASTVMGHGLPSVSGATLPAAGFDPAATSSQSGSFAALSLPTGMTHVTAQTSDAQSIGGMDVVSRAGAVTIAYFYTALPW